MRTFSRQPPVDRLKSVDLFRKCTKAQLRGGWRAWRSTSRLTRARSWSETGRAAGSSSLSSLAPSKSLRPAGGSTRSAPVTSLGSWAALSRGIRNATVSALSDLELLIIGPREFNAMAQIPGFRDALLKKMANRFALLMLGSRRPMDRKP